MFPQLSGAREEVGGGTVEERRFVVICVVACLMSSQAGETGLGVEILTRLGEAGGSGAVDEVYG